MIDCQLLVGVKTGDRGGRHDGAYAGIRGHLAVESRGHGEGRVAAEGVTDDADREWADAIVEGVLRVLASRQHVIDQEGDIQGSVHRGHREGVLRVVPDGVAGVVRRHHHEAVAGEELHHPGRLDVEASAAVGEDDQGHPGAIENREVVDGERGGEVERSRRDERVLGRFADGLLGIRRIPGLDGQRSIVAVRIQNLEGGVADRPGAGSVRGRGRSAEAEGGGGEGQREEKCQGSEETETGSDPGVSHQRSLLVLIRARCPILIPARPPA